MSAAIVPTTYLFGRINPEPSKLPEGWSWVQSPDTWLQCISPTGKRYFAHSDGMEELIFTDDSGNPGEFASGKKQPYPTT